MAEAEVAQLKARLAEEEDWQKKILERLEKKAEEDKVATAAHRIVEEERAMLQRERDALLEHVRELEDDAAEQRDAVAAAEDRAEDAEARARWAEEQRAKSLESLASCMAEAGLLKHELETLRVDALRARDEAPRVDVDAAVDLRHRPAPGSEAARLEYFLSDLGLSGEYAPKLREMGAKKVFDLVYLHDADLEDLGMEEAEKRVLKRVFARIRALVDLVCDGGDEQADAVGCSMGMGGAPSASKAAGDDCAVM